MSRFLRTHGCAILVVKATIAMIAMFIALSGVAFGQTNNTRFAADAVASDGAIRVPANFRTDYVMLGAWSVSGDVDTGGEVGLHIVYAPRRAVEAYRKTGAFPDGTVLVKELFNGKTEDLTTGRATSAGATAGYFVMVKDDKGRFPGHPLWGDGWGWSFFNADDPVRTTSTDYKVDCLGCHEPARASDLVYDYAYPVMK
jgi:hypothetical protein